MAKDPAFLFYPGDWLGGTMGMSLEEKGAYLELLVMQWNSGRITDAAAKRLVGEQLWHKLSHKFSADGNGLFNQRLEHEKQKRKKHSEKQSINAKKRWSGGNATALPLEAENENKIENENKDRGSGEGLTYDAEKSILANTVWFEQICMTRAKSLTAGKEALRKFHLYLEENSKYPRTKKSVQAGFEKWLMNEKQFNGNGKGNFTTTGTVGKTIEFDRP